jgi:hypothetical protein
MQKSKSDLAAYLTVLRDVRFMQVHELRSQHLDYLVQGLVSGMSFLHEQEHLAVVKGIMPALINAIDSDLHRYKFRNVINLLTSFTDIHTSKPEIVTSDQLSTLHRMMNKYLVEYISQNKKDINGSEYANLIMQLANAQQMGFIGVYENRLLERIVQIFIKDHQELYFFSTADQLKLLKGFDVLIAQLENPKSYLNNVRTLLVQMTLNTPS